MTRTTDSIPWGGGNNEINNRVTFINDTYGYAYDALVSIHLNSAIGNVGAYYQEGNPGLLARTIGFYYGKSVYKEDFAILRDTKGSYSIPKALVEIDRITSPWLRLDYDWFIDYQSDHLYNGLRVFFD